MVEAWVQSLLLALSFDLKLKASRKEPYFARCWLRAGHFFYFPSWKCVLFQSFVQGHSSQEELIVQ